MKKIKHFSLTAIVSSLCLGLIQYFITGAFTEVYIILVFAFYFFLAYLVFALPLQYFLNKKTSKKFSMIHLIYYLGLSLVANFLIFFFHSTPAYPSLIERPEVYFYSCAAAIIYWFWDSIFTNS
ncbi:MULTISPECIES: UPF0715 family protein [Bacillus]|uniref:UPF0715 family protein n=1 Tax=Bacillus TaxID=1386 RepID=UPI0011BF6362|nr:UPF0715 family protein [Bacillus paralicheniformis]KAA0840124.1 hypothetical protein EI977_07420 [Bacillus paralicheniformis]KAA0841249.1 hypothetical protein EI979_08065 [Bacillus paralicheniformis]MED1125881.1 UPF0715 family protein [Bacillus paralicheniformis]MED1712742.1 UPF0715 family protein [Bacillus paralicheniformis]WMW48808.1 UPF0715 family protein [Bacillus paralicheniformis]